MPKRGKGQGDDLSPGDGRKRYTDIGGVEARHAQTHDVRREQLANPKGIDRSDDEFADDIAPATPALDLHTHADESVSAADHKELKRQLPGLTAEELGRLPVLETGVRLEQGGTYLDLDDRGRGPFRSIGARETEPGQHIIAKKDVDYELWNRLVGNDHGTDLAQDEMTAQGANGA
jgi:hypothetical protein